MAGYRQIHTQIWKDEWFIELEPEEKLFFVYLFSNDLASISGLYKTPIRVMSNETGIDMKRIGVILKKFQDDGRVYYGEGTLFIKNMAKFHKNASPKTQEKVLKDIEIIPDNEIKRICIQYLYGMDTVSDEENTVSIPVSESVSVSVSESVNKIVSESEMGGDEFKDIQELSDAVIEYTKLPPTFFANHAEYHDVLKLWNKSGVIKPDIKSGMDYMTSQGRKVVSILSLKNPVLVAMADRKNGGKSNKKKRRLFDEDKKVWVEV